MSSSTGFKFREAARGVSLPRLDTLSPVASRLLRCAWWALSGAALSRGLQLLAFIPVARILGTVEFGQVAMVQSTVGSFGALAGLGMGLTANKFISELRNVDPRRAGRILTLTTAVALVSSVTVALGLWFFAETLATRTLASPLLTPLLRLGAVLLFLSTFTGVQMGTLAGFENFRRIAWINLWSGLACFPLMITGAHFAGAAGTLWALVLSTVLTCVLSEREIRRQAAASHMGYTLGGLWMERRTVWEFSLPSLVAGLVSAPAMWVANAVLVNQPNGYSELGVFNAALRIKQLPEMVVATMMSPLLPVLSEQMGRSALSECRQSLHYAFAVAWLFIVPVSLAQVAYPEATVWVYGSAYRNHPGLVQWVMLQACMLGLLSPVGSLLASLNRMWLGVAINTWWAVVFLGLCVALVPSYGSAGLAAAFALAHVVSSVSFLFYLRRWSPGLLHGIPVFTRFRVLALAAALAACAHRLGSPAVKLAVTVIIVLAVVRAGVRNSAAATTAV